MVFLFFPLGAPGQQAAVSSQRGAANEKGLAPTLQLAVWGFWPANLFFQIRVQARTRCPPPGGGRIHPKVVSAPSFLPSPGGRRPQASHFRTSGFQKQVRMLRVVLNSASSLAVDVCAAGHTHKLKSKPGVLFL